MIYKLGVYSPFLPPGNTLCQAFFNRTNYCYHNDLLISLYICYYAFSVCVNSFCGFIYKLKLLPIYSTLSKLSCDPSPKNSRNIKAAEIMTAYPACFSLSFRANVNPQITQSSTIASKISMAEVKNLMSVLLS